MFNAHELISNMKFLVDNKICSVLTLLILMLYIQTYISYRLDGYASRKLMFLNY